MIEKDLNRIATALEHIAAALTGQQNLLPCDAKPPQNEPQTVLPAEDEPQAEKPRKAAKKPENQAPEKQADKPADTQPPSVTIEDLRKVLVDTSKSEGRDAVMSVLAKFGARKASDVKPAQYGAVIAACAEAKGGAA